jgi:arginyl-tRNA synthetase
MFEQETQTIETQLTEIAAAHGWPLAELKWSHIPFAGEWGIATSFFQTAANEAKAGGSQIPVPQRAQELAEQAKSELGSPAGISRIEAVKGYLNLYFDSAQYSQRVIDTTINQEAEFGRGAETGELIMVEYSQPNTHKAMHVGHLRNMLLGDALANILEFAGHEIIRANYIGDFGRDVMKWMWNYSEHHPGEQPPDENKTRWMGDLYAEATRNLEAREDKDEIIQAMFEAWNTGDADLHDLYFLTRGWSLDGFNEVYEKMGIHFDKFYFEHEMEEAGKAYVNTLIENGLAVDERPDGAVFVKIDELLGLDKENYRTLVVLRSDSTALYATWDFALAQQKFEDYDLDRSIYVVDVRQSDHFRQVWKILEIAGYEPIQKAEHIPYEIVNLPGNITMSSREGTVVLLEDFIREAVQRAYDVSKESNPDLDEGTRQSVARAVALGAIKYPMIARDNTKIATFDWETALDFNGHSAPYIQYAHVRCNSLLRKADVGIPAALAPEHNLEEKEIELIERIAQFPAAVQRGAENYRTLELTNAAYDLAKAFSEFYNICPVLKAEGKTRDFRLRLVAAAKVALANSLKLLGIEAPDVM